MRAAGFPAQHLHCRGGRERPVPGKGPPPPLEGALPGLLADSRAEFTCAGQSYAVNGDDPSVSVDAAAVDAALTDQAGGFFTQGGRYLAAVMHGNRYSVP